MVSMEQIQELADRIAREFKPEMIILFGSYAYGTPTPDSDVDLLVVMPYEGKACVTAAAIREVLSPDIPKDVIVRSKADLQDRLRLGDSFVREVTERGNVLYESPNARVGSDKAEDDYKIALFGLSV